MTAHMPVEAHCQVDRGINARKVVENEKVRKTRYPNSGVSILLRKGHFLSKLIICCTPIATSHVTFGISFLEEAKLCFHKLSMPNIEQV